jgi:hypothetical protein
MASGPNGESRPAPSLDPGVARVLRSSAIALSRYEDTLIKQLYSDVTPLIADMAGGGQPFCERMIRALLWVAGTDQPPNAVTDGLLWVGGANWMDGFREQDYSAIAKAVIRIVRELSGSDQVTSIGSAWVSFVLWVQPYLVTGSRQAAEHYAASERAAAEEAAARHQAAEDEASRAQALALYQAGSHRDAAGDVNLETVAELLEDEDEDDGDTGYGQIMVSMTRNQRRKGPRPD